MAITISKKTLCRGPDDETEEIENAIREFRDANPEVELVSVIVSICANTTEGFVEKYGNLFYSLLYVTVNEWSDIFGEIPS